MKGCSSPAASMRPVASSSNNRGGSSITSNLFKLKASIDKAPPPLRLDDGGLNPSYVERRANEIAR